jgi:hypothetical protein
MEDCGGIFSKVDKMHTGVFLEYGSKAGLCTSTTSQMVALQPRDQPGVGGKPSEYWGSRLRG